MTSLNKMDLPPYLIAQLYSQVLVDDNSNKIAIAQEVEEKEVKSDINITTKENAWTSLGNNQKNILISVDYRDVLHVPDAMFEFLTQLLKACRLGIADVALINRNNYDAVKHTAILDHFQSQIILLFGISTAAFGFPFNIPDYQVQHYTDQIILQAPSLDILQNDRPAKSKLWTSLKIIFNV